MTVIQLKQWITENDIKAHDNDSAQLLSFIRHDVPGDRYIETIELLGGENGCEMACVTSPRRDIFHNETITLYRE